jgi:hypothetical protein
MMSEPDRVVAARGRALTTRAKLRWKRNDFEKQMR